MISGNGMVSLSISVRRALLLWFSVAAHHPFLSGGEDNLLPAEKTSIAKH